MKVTLLLKLTNHIRKVNRLEYLKIYNIVQLFKMISKNLSGHGKMYETMTTGSIC